MLERLVESKIRVFCASRESVRCREGTRSSRSHDFFLSTHGTSLKINFRLNNANTVKGFTNGSLASFFAASRALTDFHHISITSSSKWNLIRFFTTIMGPLRQNMMHGIYDNLFVKIVAKKATFAYATREEEKMIWNWKGNCDPRSSQMGQGEGFLIGEGMGDEFHAGFFFSKSLKYKWPIMTKVRDGRIVLSCILFFVLMGTIWHWFWFYFIFFIFFLSIYPRH